MLQFIRKYLMYDMSTFGEFLYKIVRKLDKFPILQAPFALTYICVMKLDMLVIDWIDERTGA